MLDLKLDSILDFLKSEGYDAQLQTETGQVYCILKIMKLEFPLFFRIFEESSLLQMIVFIPSAVKESTFNDVARLLHLINKEIDVPGFGMDESSKIAFYRIMLPAFGKKVDKNLLKSYLNSIQNICENFSPTIVAVSNGAATYQGVIKK